MEKGQASMSKSVVSARQERRYFSESARRTIVAEIEQGLSKSEASRKYEVSETTIYKWVAKYSKHYQSSLVMVVEHASDSNKVKKLEAELEAAYALLGRARAESLLLQTIIEQSDEVLGTDLKKNFDARRLQHFTTKKTKSR